MYICTYVNIQVLTSMFFFSMEQVAIMVVIQFPPRLCVRMYVSGIYVCMCVIDMIDIRTCLLELMSSLNFGMGYGNETSQTEQR